MSKKAGGRERKRPLSGGTSSLTRSTSDCATGEWPSKVESFALWNEKGIQEVVCEIGEAITESKENASIMIRLHNSSNPWESCASRKNVSGKSRAYTSFWFLIEQKALFAVYFAFPKELSLK